MEVPKPFIKPISNITKGENIRINLKLENEDYKMYLLILFKENTEYLRIKIEKLQYLSN